MNSRRRRDLALRVTFIFAFIFASCVVASAAPQAKQLERITYRLGMTRPASHLFEVSIEVETEKGFPADHLEFQMPRWSPGRYAVFDFAKNVQEFRASLACLEGSDCASVSPSITRTDNQTWRVETRGAQSLTVSYKVFGNDLSGTFSQLDTRHANFNGASVFMYIAEHKQDPVYLEIDAPGGWRVVNGRMESAEQRLWQFPNYDILIDTPTEIAPDWTVDEFKVDGKTYRVVVHSFGEEGGKRAALVRDIEKIVRAEVAMWGAPEFETYTFLIHFAADDRSGDGMEHLTSTQIIEAGALADAGTYESALDTVAHEFFHVWNVKRLRPVELGPWDFTRPLNTRSLWIAEGITNYYGHLMQRRAGVWDDEQFFHTLALYIGGVEKSPGSRLMSAEHTSLSAPFLDGGVHAQRTNLQNTSLSYYDKGEVLGIVLDLLIRGRTRGRASLDDVMRRMYDEFYIKSPKATYYLRGRGYTGEDFERVTTEVVGADMSDFFRRYVRGVDVPPYDEAFGYVGLRLVRAVAREPHSAGIIVLGDTPDVVKINTVRNNSAAEAAGLQQDDIILSIGGKNVTRETWLSELNRHKQGERVAVTVRRDRKTIQTHITLGEPDRYDYRLEDGKDATPEMRALRAAWLK
jgi:predicted metalloprotease with PDZ domain